MTYIAYLFFFIRAFDVSSDILFSKCRHFERLHKDGLVLLVTYKTLDHDDSPVLKEHNVMFISFLFVNIRF